MGKGKIEFQIYYRVYTSIAYKKSNKYVTDWKQKLNDLKTWFACFFRSIKIKIEKIEHPLIFDLTKKEWILQKFFSLHIKIPCMFNRKVDIFKSRSMLLDCKDPFCGIIIFLIIASSVASIKFLWKMLMR